MKERESERVSWRTMGRAVVDTAGWNGTASKIRLIKFLKMAAQQNREQEMELRIQKAISRAKSSLILYGTVETASNIGFPIFAGFLYSIGVPILHTGILIGTIYAQKANHARMARETEEFWKNEFKVPQSK